jgi:FixJ family two-component response regulator
MNLATRLYSKAPWTIVIVDDDSLVLEVHNEMLKLMGYTTFAFECAEDALNYIQQSGENLDLLITDYHMPEFNGLDFIQKVRDLGYNFPSMIVTGFSEAVDKARAEKFGVKVIDKPVKFHVLADHIKSFQTVC